MTRADLRARIQERLNDPDGVFTTDADADLSVDEALEVLAEETGALRRQGFVPRQPGTHFYPLGWVGPDVIVPWRVWDLTRDTRLTAVSMRELDGRHARWPTVFGEPDYWFPVGWDQFGVWPGTAQGGGVLRVDYLAWPRPLLDDGDEPDWPRADHEALVEYGVYEGWAARWQGLQTVEAWGRFQARAGLTKGRQGSRLQARGWREGMAEDGPSLPSGVWR